MIAHIAVPTRHGTGYANPPGRALCKRPGGPAQLGPGRLSGVEPVMRRDGLATGGDRRPGTRPRMRPVSARSRAAQAEWAGARRRAELEREPESVLRACRPGV